MPFFEHTATERAALNLCKQNLNLVEPHPDYATVDNPERGKCYAASIALHQYLGGRDKGYRLMRGEDENGSHYWVETPAKGILDPTVEQFAVLGARPPYKSGRGAAVRPGMQKHLSLLQAMQSQDLK